MNGEVFLFLNPFLLINYFTSRYVRASYPQLVNDVMFHPGLSYYLPTTSKQIVQAYREAWLRDNESVVGDILYLFAIKNFEFRKYKDEPEITD